MIKYKFIFLYFILSQERIFSEETPVALAPTLPPTPVSSAPTNNNISSDKIQPQEEENQTLFNLVSKWGKKAYENGTYNWLALVGIVGFQQIVKKIFSQEKKNQEDKENGNISIQKIIGQAVDVTTVSVIILLLSNKYDKIDKKNALILTLGCLSGTLCYNLYKCNKEINVQKQRTGNTYNYNHIIQNNKNLTVQNHCCENPEKCNNKSPSKKSPLRVKDKL